MNPTGIQQRKCEIYTQQHTVTGRNTRNTFMLISMKPDELENHKWTLTFRKYLTCHYAKGG